MRMKGKQVIFDYRDCWSMDSTLSKVIHAGIVKFKYELEKHPFAGYPADFHDEENDPLGDKAMKDWLDVLDKIAYAFDEDAVPDIRDYPFEFDIQWNGDELSSIEPNNPDVYETFRCDEKEHEKNRQEGLKLFAKYFDNLWI